MRVWIMIALAGCSGSTSLGGGNDWRTGGGSGASGQGSSNGSNGSGSYDSGSKGGGGTMTWPTDAGGGGGNPIDVTPMGSGTACMLPADCTTGEVCCGKLALAPGMMGCAISTYTKTCEIAATCPTNVTLSCTTQQVRTCAASTDCLEPNHPKCCTFDFDANTSATFCVSNIAAAFATTCN